MLVRFTTLRSQHSQHFFKHMSTPQLIGYSHYVDHGLANLVKLIISHNRTVQLLRHNVCLPSKEMEKRVK